MFWSWSPVIPNGDRYASRTSLVINSYGMLFKVWGKWFRMVAVKSKGEETTGRIKAPNLKTTDGYVPEMPDYIEPQNSKV